MNKPSIIHFPTPYPDETVHSIFARYCKRVGARAHSIASRAFFGTDCVVPIELPCRLDGVIGNMPIGHQLTSDLLIDRHTTFPYHGFFLREDRREAVRALMRKAGGVGVKYHLGMTGGAIRSSVFLRHCPACDAKNRSSYGETYWHRLHQINGVVVCPKHKVFLEETGIFREEAVRTICNDAESICLAKHPRSIEHFNAEHGLLLKIAVDANWILNDAKDVPDLDSVYEAYDFKLAKLGFASYTGKIKRTELVASFTTRYSEGVLKLLECEASARRSSRHWLSTFLTKTRFVFSPIQHLLLTDFLGMSTSTFMRELSDGNLSNSSLFGSKPWHCLNRFCADYKKGKIKDFIVKRNQRDKGRVIGEFKCKRCGFTYSCFGSDDVTEKQPRKIWVNNYGPIWHKNLRDAWMDNRLNIADLGKLLGVTGCVIKKQATRWDLPFPKPGQLVREGSERPGHWKARCKTIDPTTIQKMRSQWLRVIQTTVVTTVKSVVKAHAKLYRDLRRYDLPWLTSHPLRKNTKRADQKPTTYWSVEDDTMARKVAPAVSALMSQEGKPLRVSQTTLCRKIGLPSNWFNAGRKNKMPVSFDLIRRAIETKAKFAARRVLWAAAEIRSAGTPIAKTELIKLAGASSRYHWSSPEVQALITGMGLE